MRDALVICTKDRPDDVARCLESVARQAEAPSLVLVADGSADNATGEVVARFPGVRYLRVEPGLTKQRNRAVKALPPDVDVVHFVDDDAILEPEYVASIRREFEDRSVVGVGGVISNVPPRHPRLLHRFFLLDSRRPGAVLRSGRNILVVGVQGPTRVDWLSGCSMSFRAEIVRSIPFEEALRGNGFGEDVEYCLRARREGRLVATPFARLEHRTSPINRYSASRWYAAEVVARYWRVRRFPQRLGRVAFWWSVAGDLVLAVSKAVVLRRRSALILARGVAAGGWCVLRSDRRVVEG